MKPRYLAVVCAAVLLVPVACEYPYSPNQQSLNVIVVDSSRVFPVNGTRSTRMQICNPSMSQDTVLYRGCMLWLNFSGDLITANSPAGFSDPAQQHDKLIISDSANRVVWFMERPDDIPIEGEIQDPEWSTHPNYIACLGGNAANKIWDGYAVRLSDHAYLKFNEDKIDGIATPHIWISDTATAGAAASNPTYDANGFVDRESINEFFGTYDVKIAYAKDENGFTLYYLDYSQTTPTPVKLPKPEGRENWKAESPLISPDGKWVAYNCFEQLDFYVAYIQALSDGSTPYVLEEDACDPHWWVHPDDPSLVYVVYAKLTGSYYVKEDLGDKTVLQTASAGYTVKQQVLLFPGRPTHAGLQMVGSPQRLVNLPFRGGMSPDGVYMCTGYAYGYIIGLE